MRVGARRAQPPAAGTFAPLAQSGRRPTAASNSLRAYLNGNAIRLAKANLELESTRQGILQQRDWSPLQREILAEHFGDLDASKERRQRLYRLIALEISGGAPDCCAALNVLGVGLINAFALLSVIGDVRRFERPEKLVAYIGLNPGQRQSGMGKNVKLGVGKRGRGDIRHLLIQGAQAVLRMGRATALGQWGWKLFARKGNRNVAVAAVARKLLVQVWHMLSGNPPTALETHKSFTLKLHKLAAALGAPLRRQLRLGDSLSSCIHTLKSRALQAASTCVMTKIPVNTNRFDGGCAPPNPAPLAAAGVRGELSIWLACGKLRKTKQPIFFLA